MVCCLFLFFILSFLNKCEFLRFAVNLLIVSYGTTVGWPSVSFDILESPERTPFVTGPLNTVQISWLVSLFCLGGFLGTILFGILINLIGRKTYLCLLAVPQIVWNIIGFFRNLDYNFFLDLMGASFNGNRCVVLVCVTFIGRSNRRGCIYFCAITGCGNCRRSVNIWSYT